MIEFLLEDLSAFIRELRELLFLSLLVFKGLSLKIIKIPKWHILGWCNLLPFTTVRIILS